jgi:hypothetical protein
MAEQAKQIAMDVESSKAGMNKASALDKVASAASKWADISMRPEQHAQEQQAGDRGHEMAQRDFGQRREESSRQFQGQDADRQAKIEDMRARQAQAAQRQQPTNGGAY